MKELAIRKKINGTIDSAIEKVTKAISPLGFGILTKIDFDQKMKEKLGESIPRSVVLGACNPKLAFEAYKQTKDVLMLIPCNIVVREEAAGEIMIEAIRPSAMLSFLPSLVQNQSVLEIEKSLELALQKL